MKHAYFNAGYRLGEKRLLPWRPVGQAGTAGAGRPLCCCPPEILEDVGCGLLLERYRC